MPSFCPARLSIPPPRAATFSASAARAVPPPQRLPSRHPLQVSSRPGCGGLRPVLRRAGCQPAEDNSLEYKEELTYQLLRAKEESGKTFDEIADEIGLTNCYTAQLFHNQARLTDSTAERLKAAVPALTEDQLAAMKRAPMRIWNKDILLEPNVYRTHEAVTHYGESIKALVNEQLGDGIMSAIDFFMTVKAVKGKQGEDRVVITFNGKFLPYREQVQEDNTV